MSRMYSGTNAVRDEVGVMPKVGELAHYLNVDRPSPSQESVRGSGQL